MRAGASSREPPEATLSTTQGKPSDAFARIRSVAKDCANGFCMQGDSDHQTAGVGDERNAAAEGSSRAGSVSGPLSINTKSLVPSTSSQMAVYIVLVLYITQLPRARDISSMLSLPPLPKLDASHALWHCSHRVTKRSERLKRVHGATNRIALPPGSVRFGQHSIS